MPGGAMVVVVVGACGGVGASTFAALLAREAARTGGGAVLVELDGSGPGLEVLLGVEEAPGVRWPDLADLRGSLAAEDLDGVLPVWRGVEVLGTDRRGGGPAEAALDALWPVLRARCATVVVDAPAHALAGPAARLVTDDDATRVAVVTSQDVRGVAAALTALTGWRTAAPVRGAPEQGGAHLMLRRRRGARVGPLEAAHVLDVPLLGMLPTDRRVAEATDRGFGPLVGRRSGLGRAVGAAARGLGVGGRPRSGRVGATVGRHG